MNTRRSFLCRLQLPRVVPISHAQPLTLYTHEASCHNPCDDEGGGKFTRMDSAGADNAPACAPGGA